MGNQPVALTLYGATGFTGRLAARYLAAKLPPGDARWAIAGRNEAKLRRLRADLGRPDVDVMVADSSDTLAVEKMVQGSRLLLSTAGPFTLHGEPVVAACARLGVHYADITGETAFVRQLIDRYQAVAEASGAKILPFCGFDSIPSDLGVFVLVSHLRARGGQGAGAVKGYFRLRGGVNGGSLATMMLMAGSDQARAMRDPWLLNPSRSAGGPHQARHADPVLPRYDQDLDEWVAPFVMGPINTRVVRRSAALASQWGEGYGPSFGYQEYWRVGRRFGLVKAGAAAGFLGLALGGLRSGAVRNLVAPLLPSPGSGPADAKRESGFFHLSLIGSDGNGSKVRATVADQGDPSNEVTVKLLCEAGLCMVKEAERLPGGVRRAGFLTPATGLGQVLVDRLRAAGMALEVAEA